MKIVGTVLRYLLTGSFLVLGVAAFLVLLHTLGAISLPDGWGVPGWVRPWHCVLAVLGFLMVALGMWQACGGRPILSVVGIHDAEISGEIYMKLGLVLVTGVVSWAMFQLSVDYSTISTFSLILLWGLRLLPLGWLLLAYADYAQQRQHQDALARQAEIQRDLEAERARRQRD